MIQVRAIADQTWQVTKRAKQQEIKMNVSQQVIVDYVQFENWEDAVAKTPIELFPVAVNLHTVSSPLPDIDAEISDNYHPYALIAMTTRFVNEEFECKLGWIHLRSDVKKILSNLLFDAGKTDEWVFFAQIPQSQD